VRKIVVHLQSTLDNRIADAPEITPAFAEFARLQHRMTKVVFSNSMEPRDGRVVIGGDLAGQLRHQREG
jgi:hypothetical protein